MPSLRLTPLRLAAAIVLGSASFAGVAYAATLGLTSGHLYAWSQMLSKGSCNQTSATADDTYVQQASPNSTAGGIDTTLTIGGAGGSLDDAFIRFDLGGCNLPATAGADTAALTLYVTSKSNDTISLYPVYSSWSSATLAWNGLSGLAIGSTPTTSFVASTPGSVTLPVTADVDRAIRAGTLWGWELRDTSGTATTAVGSSENNAPSKRPSLALQYEQ